MGAAAIPIAATVLGGALIGSQVYQGIEANKARKQAEDAANEQARQTQAATDKLIADQKAQQEKMASDQAALDENTKTNDVNNAARDTSRRRQTALRAGAGTRQWTILTSPLGDVSTPTTTAKTLLGS